MYALSTRMSRWWYRYAWLLFAISTVAAEADTAALRRRQLQDTAEEDNSDSAQEIDLEPEHHSKACQSVHPLSKNAFDLNSYVEKSWFVQKQQVNPYQGEDALFCVVATYKTRADGYVQVLNSANRGSVDGEEIRPNQDDFFTQLCAEQLSGGKLRVGPCLLNLVADLIHGPYWVLAVGENYSWAIVSAGAPDQYRKTVSGGKNLCTTSSSTCFLDINGSGLWLFTREQEASDETISIMMATLRELGVYAGDLKDVAQTGCTYPDYIKT
ncbi:expressed unknown protein [Seminavis robusta]|uniref:Lipocalin/cytosolic fatty-acid binding domain-containing protein n=1 Tax=Seminavis robusta TaxID=568900 RepID=A0A9N8HFP3_9STRA|nr:expressed unknown protein [Seminavis robusta]|eukprot:Sro584_g170780.1 n/a (269) ;mRNA; f:17349-18155